MGEERDIIHILRLLDDDSPKVRRHVWERLESHLPAWEGGIRARLPELPEGIRRRLEELLSGRARRGFRQAWPRWREVRGDMERLEAALAGLSWYLAEDRAGRKRSGDGAAPVNRDRRIPTGGDAGLLRHPSLAVLLDGLARDYLAAPGAPSPSSLAAYLFVERGFCGADVDYYDPGNSDLVQVIERKRGIPISLACLFMLVGHRVGLPIFGCDVPEHFLTRAREGGRDLIIDCYDRGRILEGERLAQLERKYAPGFSRLLDAPAAPEAIVARVLRNLINAYHLAGDREGSQFMYSLAEDLRGEPDPAAFPGGSGEEEEDGAPGGEADSDGGPEGPWSEPG
jgi:hypothetical protein